MLLYWLILSSVSTNSHSRAILLIVYIFFLGSVWILHDNSEHYGTFLAEPGAHISRGALGNLFYNSTRTRHTENGPTASVQNGENLWWVSVRVCVHLSTHPSCVMSTQVCHISLRYFNSVVKQHSILRMLAGIFRNAISAHKLAHL